jgi:hypothetical protein
MGPSEMTNENGAACNGLARVLVFCRPYLIRDFRENVAPLENEFDFAFLTDGKCWGTRDTRERFYANLAAGTRCEAITSADEDQIRSRCRLLNNLDPKQATALIHAMGSAFDEELERWPPKCILCQLVDEYVTHTLTLLAAKRGIRVISYFQSYIPGFVQLTEHAHGQAFKVREPASDEIQSTVRLLQRARFRQDYRQRSNATLRQHLLGVARYQIKKIVFAFKAKLERDPWNLHYAITPYIAERRRVSDFPKLTDFEVDWCGALKRLKTKEDTLVVYLPLPYVPEATTNYWVENRKIIDYDQQLIEIISELTADGNMIVAVKEHLHMLGARAIGLYRKLRDLENVVSIHPSELSVDVLNACDAVVIGTGSIGIEATMAGKPVFSYSDTSFWFRPSRATFLDLDEVASWDKQIRQQLSRRSTIKGIEPEEFVRTILKSTVRLRSAGQKWPLVDVDDLRTVLSIAAVPRDPNEPAFCHVI